jgi:hypothetical protein
LRTTGMTWCPSATREVVSARPMRPEAPVMAIFTRTPDV